MEKSFNSNTPKLVGGVVLTAIALIGIYVFVLQGANNQESDLGTTSSNIVTATATPTSSSKASSTATPTSASVASTYTDGTYAATVSYSVPRGSNKLTAELTISNGAVTAVSTTHDYTDRESGEFISNFDAKIKASVVGKNISSLSLSRIGGASLTTRAFTNALTTIKNDAA
jgi:hypothetical protein